MKVLGSVAYGAAVVCAWLGAGLIVVSGVAARFADSRL